MYIDFGEKFHSIDMSTSTLLYHNSVEYSVKRPVSETLAHFSPRSICIQHTKNIVFVFVEINFLYKFEGCEVFVGHEGGQGPIARITTNQTQSCTFSTT